MPGCEIEKEIEEERVVWFRKKTFKNGYGALEDKICQ
jgi:hypothetical protein